MSQKSKSSEDAHPRLSAEEAAVAWKLFRIVERGLSRAELKAVMSRYQDAQGSIDGASKHASEEETEPDSGKRFMLWLAILLVFLVSIYAWLHVIYPARDTPRAPNELIRIDQFGTATVISAEDLAWQVGDQKATPLVTQLTARNERITALRNELDAQLRRAEQALAGARRAEPFPFFTIAARSDDRMLHDLAEKTATVSRDLSSVTLQGGVDQALRDLRFVAHQLEALRRAQNATRDIARPPDKYLVFWMNAHGILVEALFWAFFGTFVSLIFHTARALNTRQRKNGFKPVERWIGFSKLVYAPIVTAVLVFALWLGLIEFGGPELRAWSLPLVGVLIGFNVRKAVDVVDTLSEMVLGRFLQATKRTDTERQIDVAKKLAPLSPPALPFLPQTLGQVRAETKAVATKLLEETLKTKSS